MFSVAEEQTLLEGRALLVLVHWTGTLFFMCRNKTREGASIAQSHTANWEQT